MEPVSPELVLVDPELAQAERARLASRDNVVGLVGDRVVSTRPDRLPFSRVRRPSHQRGLSRKSRKSAYTKSSSAGGCRRRPATFQKRPPDGQPDGECCLDIGRRRREPRKSVVSAFPATLSKGRETSAHTTTAAKTPRSSSPTKRVKRQRQTAPKTVGELTALSAETEPSRHGRFAVRWLNVLLAGA